MAGKFAVPVPSGLPRVYIETLAREAAEKLEYKAGGDIFAAAERLGGRIRFGSVADIEKQSGTLAAQSLTDWTMYLSPIETALRDRFTVACHIGHLILHLPQCKKRNALSVMRAGRYQPQGDILHKRAVWEANWFAFAFLMPAAEFAPLFKEAGKAACGLRFGVSGLVVRARAQNLGLGVFL